MTMIGAHYRPTGAGAGALCSQARPAMAAPSAAWLRKLRASLGRDATALLAP